MTHVTCRLTAKNRDQLRILRSVIEYGIELGRYRFFKSVSVFQKSVSVSVSVFQNIAISVSVFGYRLGSSIGYLFYCAVALLAS